MNGKINWSLYGAAISVNIVSLISGCGYGWTSPVLPKLKNENDLSDNPFGKPITSFEESWITSIISIGAAVGPFFGAIIVDRIGRKKTLLLLVLPIILANLVLAFATDIILYYVSRFLLGLTFGCVYSIVPIYVGEIAEDSNRGNVGCFLSMMCTIGTLLCFIIGPYVSIKIFCLILIIPVIVFLISFGLFSPESPYYLLMMNRDDEARAALKKLRRNYVEKELEEMKKNVEISSSTSTNLKDSLKSPTIIRGLYIGCGLMFFQQFSGITVIISYMQPIFDASGSTIPPEISTIIVGSIQLMANLTTSQLVDRLGRKILLLGSLVGGCVAHTILGVYFYLKTHNYDDVVSYLFWLPVCCLILYIVLFMFGLGPVTWAMIGELFPTHFRSFASTLTCFVCLFLAFILTFFFPNFSEMLGMAASFWLFGTSCAFGVIFVWKVVPETKGKSLHDIQMILENRGKC
ncbi:hypothetical protein Zmor_023330 [Zophobas morio]|uniref:Major facilitator superfamily (MFS) profile domain-containing protein n=1 Tax=Zophobas morio TaxID=2755281 RepID=A0AA38I2X3_9CUCU|nr:hypothetical protein Zmor_023330 [Zophobas morio]